MMRSIVCLVVLMVCSINAIVEVKNLAGPASEFGLYSLPTPLQSADIQNSASFSLSLAPTSDANVLSQSMELPVDSDEQFQIVFYSPYNNSLILTLVAPNGKSILLRGQNTYYPIGDKQIPATQYSFLKPQKGKYMLTVTSSPLQTELYNKIAAPDTDAYIVMWNEDSLATHTALNTYSLLTNSQVGLVSRVFTQTFSAKEMLSGKAPLALNRSVEKAEMVVTLPDGALITKPMVDDGLHADGAANDGVFGGLITAPVAGKYIFSATISGKNEDGDDYVRTTQQLVTVVDPDISLTGSAIGTYDSTKTKLNINLVTDAPVGKKYKGYAQVWGTNATGAEVPICWIAGMSYIQVNGGVQSMNLQLDLNWVSRAGAKEPLVLKNVVIQDSANFVPVEQFDIIPVKTETLLSEVMSTQNLMGKNGEITDEMREGKRPARLSAANVNATSATLILVHGYCTDQNPFQVYPEDWTNAQFFLNPNQNLNHDQFALTVMDWAEQFGAYSYVGHSQGGPVGLHLKNFYWSGLDLVSGGRVVQSVGSPYQGSSGAGTAADLAKIFGVLCGANQDLARDGAALWMNGVTQENRAKVHYYTSTYAQGKFLGDYCNLATNIVLSWPNDGLAEHEYSQLPGGQNEGSEERWCHSVGMKYPPQCQNRPRNKIMNQEAARNIQ